MGSLIGDTLETDGSFTLTPRQSRLGVKAGYGFAEDSAVRANIEVDLFGFHENAGPAAATSTVTASVMPVTTA